MSGSRFSLVLVSAAVAALLSVASPAHAAASAARTAGEFTPPPSAATFSDGLSFAGNLSNRIDASLFNVGSVAIALLAAGVSAYFSLNGQLVDMKAFTKEEFAKVVTKEEFAGLSNSFKLFVVAVTIALAVSLFFELKT